MGKEHDWLHSKNMFQCKGREFRTGPQNGTVMENSKLTLRKWLMAIPFIGSAKQGFTTLGGRWVLAVTKPCSVYAARSLSLGRDNGYKLEDGIGYDVE